MTRKDDGRRHNRKWSSAPPSSWMKFPPLLLLLVLLLLFASTIPMSSANGGFRLCGLKLTMMLNSICKNQLCGGYMFGLGAKKRSSSPAFDSLLDFGGEQSSSSYAWPVSDQQMEEDAWYYGAEEPKQFLALELPDNDERRTTAATVVMPSKRGAATIGYHPYGVFGVKKKSGIATECCLKRCTLKYLKTYCCAAPKFENELGNETIIKHNRKMEKQKRRRRGNELDE